MPAFGYPDSNTGVDQVLTNHSTCFVHVMPLLDTSIVPSSCTILLKHQETDRQMSDNDMNTEGELCRETEQCYFLYIYILYI